MPLFQNTLWRSVLSLSLLATCLIGCAGDDNKDNFTEKPVETLYEDGSKAFADGDYKQSAKSFEEVERQYPLRNGRPKPS